MSKLPILLSLMVLYIINPTNTYAQVWEGDYIIETQADVDNFSTTCNCTEITENLMIMNTGIENLEGLSTLISVSGDLSIDNTDLRNLEGLRNLTSIGKLFYVSNNPYLKNLDGLNNLASIEESFYLGDNGALTDIEGLSKLTSIEGALIVEHNPTLMNLEGLRNLTLLGGDLRIVDNAALTNLEGLSKLTSVEVLDISRNAALTNLDGLRNFTSVGALSIRSNPTLTNIDGLSNLTLVEGYLMVSGNTGLSACCVVACWQLKEITQGDYFIGRSVVEEGDHPNASGCNSLAEIQVACYESSCDWITRYDPTPLQNMEIKLYPNPTPDFVSIRLSGAFEFENALVSLHSLTGRLIHTAQINTNQPLRLNTTNMAEGIYMVTIDVGEGQAPIVRKLMIAAFSEGN